MAKPDTWMPMHWADFWKDTNALSAVEQCAYFNLLGAAWINGAWLPDDNNRLQRMARVTETEWRTVGATVTAYFERADGRLTQRRLTVEYDKAMKAYTGRYKHILTVNSKRRQSLNTDTDHTKNKEESTYVDESSLRSDSADEKGIDALAFKLSWPSFWKLYPHKIGKKAAEAAFRKAISNVTPNVIITGLEAYIANKPADHHWMHAATFLNGERWNDDYASNNDAGAAGGSGVGQSGGYRQDVGGVTDIVNRLTAYDQRAMAVSGDWGQRVGPAGHRHAADDGIAAGGGSEAQQTGNGTTDEQRMLPAPRQDEAVDGEPGRAGSGFGSADSALRADAVGISGGRSAPGFINAATKVEMVARVAGIGGTTGAADAAPQGAPAGHSNADGLDIPPGLSAAAREARARLGGLETKDGAGGGEKALLARTFGDGPAAKRTIGE